METALVETKWCKDLANTWFLFFTKYCRPSALTLFSSQVSLQSPSENHKSQLALFHTFKLWKVVKLRVLSQFYPNIHQCMHWSTVTIIAFIPELVLGLPCFNYQNWVHWMETGTFLNSWIKLENFGFLQNFLIPEKRKKF